ncbi:replication-relaxation family protein [Ralstonia sp. GX3-BWBA]|uniref:replication-relaxation family protein n=1 Tax=Ralstonia sp. GX3-BWBA TaxID=2219865 RepID=UPI000DD4D932|nr:replication-relaxation family protein [Ralstonia sp. GX3-BWBA]
MDKRQQGQHYRRAALFWLARLGYATTRQLAKLLHGSCTESAVKMTGRTLRRLREEGLVVAKRDGDSVLGELLLAVNAKGAAWLFEHGKALPREKTHARDWLRHAHSHRTACNSVFVALTAQSPELAPWSELEVRAQMAPLDSIKYHFDGQVVGKVPDLLVATPSGLEWVEVENSWRRERDLDKMVASMQAMFYQPTANLARVHFVVTVPSAKTIGQRLRRKLTHGPGFSPARQIRELDARILAQHIIVSTLDHERLELVRVGF